MVMVYRQIVWRHFFSSTQFFQKKTATSISIILTNLNNIYLPSLTKDKCNERAENAQALTFGASAFFFYKTNYFNTHFTTERYIPTLWGAPSGLTTVIQLTLFGKAR